MGRKATKLRAITLALRMIRQRCEAGADMRRIIAALTVLEARVRNWIAQEEPGNG